jgi:hypothetical protein
MVNQIMRRLWMPEKESEEPEKPTGITKMGQWLVDLWVYLLWASLKIPLELFVQVQGQNFQAVLKCLGLTGKITNHSERELTWVMELTWAVNQMSSLNPWSQNEFSSNRDNWNNHERSDGSSCWRRWLAAQCKLTLLSLLCCFFHGIRDRCPE